MSRRVLFPSAARTATTDTADQTDENAEGVHVIIDVTAVTGTTPTLTPRIQGKDPASGGYYDILVGVAITATGMTVLKVGPGLAATANAAASDVLPDVWRLRCDIGGTTPSFTFSVGAVLAE